MKRSRAVLVAAALMASVIFRADAQPDVKPRSRTQAIIAYDTATDFYRSGRFRDAAALFLKADILEPSAAALLMAYRSYRKIGDTVMASRLDKQFQTRYSDKRFADETKKEGIVCVTVWELEILRSRMTAAGSLIDDMLKGEHLSKVPKNPY